MFPSLLRLLKANATSTFALIALLGSAAAVRAQVGTRRVGVKPLLGAEVMVKQTPLTIGKVKSAQPAKVETVRVGALLAIAQIAQGQLTPQQAWEQKLLDADDILQLLSRPERLTQDDSNEALKRDLAGLLVKFAPETVATPDTLSARVRLELCHYYSEQGDERAVPLCEALIADKLDGKQTKMPTGAAAEPDNVSLWLGGVIYLAQYYEKVGQWQKAGETWERALTFWQDANWWQAGVRIDAARAYQQTGDDEKSKKLYAQVPQYGEERSTVTAICEQAAIETRKGNSAHARQILLQPNLTGLPAVQLVVSSVVAHSYYVDGDFSEARQLFTQVIDQAQTLKGSNDDRNEAAIRVSTAKEHLRLIEQWMQTPLACEPSQLSIRSLYLGDEPVTRWLYVSSFRDVPVKVESNNPLITIKEGQKKWEDDEQLQYNQEFEVTIATVAQQSTNSWLTVTSARFPTVHVQVPVQFTTLKGGDQIENSSEKTP